MIKAVIFDLGGVYFSDGTSLAVEKISEGYKIPKEVVRKTLATKSKIGTLYRRGEIAPEEFWAEAMKEWELKEDYKKLSEIWVKSYQLMRTVKLVERLKKAGVKLFFLSDSVKERAEYLQEKYNFLENFIGGVFSHIVHKTKSDGEDSFRIALDKTGERAEDVVYIDDKEEYVETARRIGMNGIHFKSPEQLETGLKSLGVKF
ncbi:MAG: HAD hydrolase-like protein [Candidatus Aenigmarchaeota archaeon]|nr:HAD hydrolase-like protein [Candidatus Aenigmarchaeota archaeon]